MLITVLAAVGLVTCGLIAASTTILGAACGYEFGRRRSWWADPESVPLTDGWPPLLRPLPPALPKYDAVAASLIHALAGELRRAYWDGQLSVKAKP